MVEIDSTCPSSCLVQGAAISSRLHYEGAYQKARGAILSFISIVNDILWWMAKIIKHFLPLKFNGQNSIHFPPIKEFKFDFKNIKDILWWVAKIIKHFLPLKFNGQNSIHFPPIKEFKFDFKNIKDIECN